MNYQAFCISNSHCSKEKICPPPLPQMFPYRTESSVNRQTDDTILSIKYFFKMMKRIGPKTEPCGIPDTCNTWTGTEAWPIPILQRVEKNILPLSHIQVH